MRVLYASHTSTVSGAERTLLDLLANLPPGVEPVVASPDGVLAHRVKDLGVAWRLLPGTTGSLKLHPARTPKALAEIARSALHLRRLAARLGADLIHANSVRAGLVATGSRWCGGPPVVVHVHDHLTPGRMTSSIGAVLRSGSAAFFTISAWAECGLGDGRRVPLHRVGNPVDLDRFVRAEEPRGEPPTLGVVAQITPWKGQLEAIEALAMVRQEHPAARLLLVGEVKFAAASTRFDNRAYMHRLLARRAELGLLDAVELLGEREDIPELLQEIDVLLVPSWGEPFGRAMIEAMASGVPVVATDVGGPAEVIEDGISGRLVPVRDPHALALAVSECLADSELRRRIGDGGRDVVARRFDSSAYAQRVVRVYEHTLG